MVLMIVQMNIHVSCSCYVAGCFPNDQAKEAHNFHRCKGHYNGT
jgi:hypothetical protein